MVRQNDLGPAFGARHKPKRLGRGYGSGHGATSGKGHKGQKARSGGKIPPYFEGGQLPLVQRLPEKRGFTNAFRREYVIVNLGQLALWEQDRPVTPEGLVTAGLVKSPRQPIKILGDGNVSKPLVVIAHKFSASARKKIEAAGGRVELIDSTSANN
ncbi:MAG: 50S ribosomal protein L15 [Chloroflexi bacterium]|nr:50S ribosomal protein L15 [Chloroflexota bacterium]